MKFWKNFLKRLRETGADKDREREIGREGEREVQRDKTERDGVP